MRNADGTTERPEITAASRGGDPDQQIDGEADFGTATLGQALFWAKVYGEILAMEEGVMERIQDLMALESPIVRRELELTDVPVIASHLKRFRQRHLLWELKVNELQRDLG